MLLGCRDSTPGKRCPQVPDVYPSAAGSLWRLVMETTARHRREWRACGLRVRLGTHCRQQRNLHVGPNRIQQIGQACDEPRERMHFGTVLIAIETARPDDVAERIGLERRGFECGEPFVRG